MALFEFDNGQFYPAQFGRPVDGGISDQVFNSIERQVLDLVNRPLLPVTWIQNRSRLVALDASGQVVSVQVLRSLDSQSMVAALGALNEVRTLGWNELSQMYPGGQAAFRAALANFRSSMPANATPGPRLIVVAAHVSQGLRPAIEVLAASGMEVNEVSLREMSNGRRFIEVTPVTQSTWTQGWLGGRNGLALESDPAITEDVPSGPARASQIQHSPAVTRSSIPQRHRQHRTEEPGQEPQRPQKAPATRPTPERQRSEQLNEQRNAQRLRNEVTARTPKHPIQHSEPNIQATQEQQPESAPRKVPAGVPRRARRRTDVGTAALANVQRDLTPTRMARHRTHTPRPAQQRQLERDAQGLEAIGMYLRKPTELLSVWGEVTYHATLRQDGAILVRGQRVDSPAAALAAHGARPLGDGWAQWHLHHPQGPTLEDALRELLS